jgi:hypothetical protein
MRQHPNVLVRIAERLFPFTAPDGRAFVQFPVGPNNDGRISFPVRSDTCRTWFDRHYHVETDRVASRDIHQTFCRHLESQALYGPYRGELPVYRRAASLDGRIAIDLANPDGEYIEVTPDGHRITCGEAGPAFETSAATLPLPAPAPSTDALDQLRRLLRVDGHPWFRILCWLLSALRSAGPIPILILRGPTRSGKSFAARILRALVDPNSSPFAPTPHSDAHLLNLARQNWVLAFDHIATLSPAISDTLCRLSTGAAAAPQWIRRPILLTVTNNFVPAPDLAARALIVDLPTLDTVRPESDLADEFLALRPRVLDALCVALSRALKVGPAAHPTDAFPEIAAALTAPPPVHPVVQYLSAFVRPLGAWTGTAPQLLVATRIADTPNALSRLLNRLLLPLHDAGIEFTRTHRNHARLITLKNVSPPPCLTPVRPPEPLAPGPRPLAPSSPTPDPRPLTPVSCAISPTSRHRRARISLIPHRQPDGRRHALRHTLVHSRPLCFDSIS